MLVCQQEQHPLKPESPLMTNYRLISAESTAWIGLDAHARSCLLGWMDEQGQRRQCWRFATQERAIIEHLKLIPAKAKYLAVEECGLGRWIAQVAKPHVTEVVVCDPRHNASISRHHHKCDEEDSYGLARLYRLGELKAVWQPKDQSRSVFKCAVQSYLDAVQRQTALKLQIKAHFRQWGVIPLGSSVYSRRGREPYLNELKEEGVRQQQRLLYELMDGALENESKARRLMIQQGKHFPEIMLLQSVPGVGRIGAHLFSAYIQEPARFEKPSQLYRYCRLGIRDRSSDNKPLGYQQLDRHGHGVLKAMTYRAWLTAMRLKKGPIYQFYLASLKRSGNEVHARLNTQRKVLMTLWTMWKNNAMFEAAKFFGTQAQLTATA